VAELNVTVWHPPQTRADPPDLNREKKIVVRERRDGAPREPGNLIASSWTYALTSFEVGTHAVATGSVAVSAQDGSVTNLPFPDLSLRVESTLASTNAPMRDIKGLAGWPGPSHLRLLAVLALIALVALAAGYIAWRRTRKPRPAAPAAPPVPAHEVALRALADLLAKRWIEEEQVEPFYVAVSGIVRTYLEQRFQMRATEQTTEEFIRDAVQSRFLSPAHKDLTRAFLEQSDLVKFARHRPGAPEMRGAYEAAERLVRETIPAPEPSMDRKGVAP